MTESPTWRKFFGDSLFHRWPQSVDRLHGRTEVAALCGLTTYPLRLGEETSQPDTPTCGACRTHT